MNITAGSTRPQCPADEPRCKLGSGTTQSVSPQPLPAQQSGTQGRKRAHREMAPKSTLVPVLTPMTCERACPPVLWLGTVCGLGLEWALGHTASSPPCALGSWCCLVGSFGANGQHLTLVMKMGYLVTFIASPSAHPVGPDRGEESQVVAIGLCEEHRLPGMQGKAGAGVPLLKKQDHRRVKATTGVVCLPQIPSLSYQGFVCFF